MPFLLWAHRTTLIFFSDSLAPLFALLPSSLCHRRCFLRFSVFAAAVCVRWRQFACAHRLSNTIKNHKHFDTLET